MGVGITGNVAYHKRADQVGDFLSYNATFAVDGKLDPDWYWGQSCAFVDSGDNDTAAWWYVDLGSQHEIYEMTVFIREEYRGKYTFLIIV